MTAENDLNVMNITTKILVPQMKGVYSSFPTITQHDDRIYVFYRQGMKSNSQVHGIDGKVRCFEINKNVCIDGFNENTDDSLFSSGNDNVVFESDNEIDAIVSRLDEDLFTLCTRRFVRNRPMRSYVSVSNTPNFSERNEVNIKGTEWMAFYGKAFKSKHGHIFPAYGDLKGERPLVLVTDDFSSWDVLSYISGDFKGFVLNESSIIFDGDTYMIFMREDTENYLDNDESFGIWYSMSDDLENWTAPEKLTSWAQAPMAAYKNGEMFLTFREFIDADTTAVSLISTLTDKKKTVIEKYRGNPYDGGYSDICIMDNSIFVVYYVGNEEGEPFLKLCRIK